ncbi:MAG: hypothetical protein M3N97_08050 [Pseudomonadota bacterium]|nr:hypothetical protein [Pseudomonadota bacterium]
MRQLDRVVPDMGPDIHEDASGRQKLRHDGKVLDLVKAAGEMMRLNGPNAEDFQRWLAANHYVTVRKFRRYDTNENYMVVPSEAAA